MLEVELRAKVDEKVELKIKQLGAKLVSDSKELDDYYKFADDKDRKIIIRIRKNESGTFLTFKGSAKGEDIAWQEWEQKIDNSDVLDKLFVSNRVIKLLTIDKERKKFKFNEFEINFDKIKNLGTFVEVELMAEDEAIARKRILELFSKLEIKETDLINKGYVKLMLKE